MKWLWLITTAVAVYAAWGSAWAHRRITALWTAAGQGLERLTRAVKRLKRRTEYLEAVAQDLKAAGKASRFPDEDLDDDDLSG
jgi:hypothetical protein